ncbi:PaaI family thioesterase [Salinarimonas ramus]|uniref:Medium/long-chain acyl-CoA thioesterase YigI n=1 Tax=Salinarimonas ramus TaxID=690164 RepID=A0A917Q4G8_9HYPH|nr:PaaI family thioesterase [Salinarimonas ramus]GGK24110.1 thioesterase [Salinarimonas ramus]
MTSLAATAARIEASFAKQALMTTLGATLESVEPGRVVIVLPVVPALFQQHGFVHAGAVATIADSAAGYAALTRMPEGRGVLTAEFKINLLAPAAGARLVAIGTVVKAGRTLTLSQAEVFAEAIAGDAGSRKLCALLTATLMAIEDRAGIVD